MNRAQCHLQLGDYSGCIEDLMEAANIDPDKKTYHEWMLTRAEACFRYFYCCCLCVVVVVCQLICFAVCGDQI